MTIKKITMIRNLVFSTLLLVLWLMPQTPAAQNKLLTVAEAEARLSVAQKEYQMVKDSVQALPKNKQEEAQKALRDAGRKVGYCRIEVFKANKREFLREQAQLTEQEAARLFPVYEELQTKLFNIHDEAQRATKRLLRKPGTDADYSAAVQKRLDAQLQEAQIQWEYAEKLKKLLPPKKLMLLYDAEQRFSHEMMRKPDDKAPQPAKK